MKHRFLALLATIAIVAGGLYIFSDPGRVGIYDADLNRLAESAREGYCTGFVFWDTGGRGDKNAVDQCLEEQTDRSNAIDHSAVILQFCHGAKDAGFPGSIFTECKPVVEQRRLWPTMKGTLTRAFDDRYPYPGDLFAPTRSDTPDPTRGTEREGFTR